MNPRVDVFISWLYLNPPFILGCFTKVLEGLRW